MLKGNYINISINVTRTGIFIQLIHLLVRTRAGQEFCVEFIYRLDCVTVLVRTEPSLHLSLLTPLSLCIDKWTSTLYTLYIRHITEADFILRFTIQQSRPALDTMLRRETLFCLILMKHFKQEI